MGRKVRVWTIWLAVNKAEGLPPEAIAAFDRLADAGPA